MVVSYDIEAGLAFSPVTVTQREDDPLYFDWVHTPGRPECDEILAWFSSQGIKPFIAEQNYPGGSEFAGYDFTGQSELAVLFKLVFC